VLDAETLRAQAYMNVQRHYEALLVACGCADRPGALKRADRRMARLTHTSA